MLCSESSDDEDLPAFNLGGTGDSCLAVPYCRLPYPKAVILYDMKVVLATDCHSLYCTHTVIRLQIQGLGEGRAVQVD